MDWLDRLNNAVAYLDENLTGTIDYHHAAQIACCSEFHFQRIFSYIAGIPLSEYIRKRKMTEAAFDLQNTDMKIIDTALKFGYESPTAFNRAFQNVHGIAPSNARSEGVNLKAYPRIRFQLSVTGGSEMNYRIEKKAAFKIAGIKKSLPVNVEENFTEIPQFWNQFFQSGLSEKLCAIMDSEPSGILGVCSMESDGKEFDYYIAAATTKEVSDEFCIYIVPETLWAIFECIGAMPNAIQELEKRIVTEWLPTSRYEYSNGPDIEVYPEGDINSPIYKSEVWLPIQKK